MPNMFFMLSVTLTQCVRFDLGHRHDEVGRKHGPRQPQMMEPVWFARVATLRSSSRFRSTGELLTMPLGVEPTLGEKQV
jgi:hypothetical protein